MSEVPERKSLLTHLYEERDVWEKNKTPNDLACLVFQGDFCKQSGQTIQDIDF